MIETAMLTMFAVTAVTWLALWFDAHLLLHRFVARFPDIADREIPHASDRGVAHPEKALFFYRKKATEILSADPAPARQRRRVLILTILAILVPALGMFSLILTAVIMSHS